MEPIKLFVVEDQAKILKHQLKLLDGVPDLQHPGLGHDRRGRAAGDRESAARRGALRPRPARHQRHRGDAQVEGQPPGGRGADLHHLRRRGEGAGRHPRRRRGLPPQGRHHRQDRRGHQGRPHRRHGDPAEPGAPPAAPLQRRGARRGAAPGRPGARPPARRRKRRRR